MVAVPLIQGATLAIALSSSASLHAATTTGALRRRSDIVNGTQPRFIYIGSSSLLGSIGIESSSHASSVMSTSLNPPVAAPVLNSLPELTHHVFQVLNVLLLAVAIALR
ncbi:hypothetical protein PI125_g19182 [Phytophthora idaei]|nr:hypothetical protein PI125_g19182 [Phytophthora idaei]KAG3137738.1 hypothetical protein PI126_g17234 [Phytophthora idaei]